MTNNTLQLIAAQKLPALSGETLTYNAALPHDGVHQCCRQHLLQGRTDF